MNFLIHDFSAREPFGGIKVQYEYASRLSALGHDVAIYHSLNFDRGVLTHPSSVLGLVHHNLRGRRMVGWFSLPEGVQCRFAPRIVQRFLRPADATIVDSFAMAERIPAPTPRTGPVFHIVYEFPVWKHGRQDLKDRLARSLRRTDIGHIATSTAVEEMLHGLGATPLGKITCGIELPEGITVPPPKVREPVVGFAMRPEPYKGAADMLAALPLIEREFPAARFECFGRSAEGTALPAALTMHGYLDDQQLANFYRRCSVFVSPSHAEGWGLTAAEAMANGAAVVVTKDGGSRDFAVDGKTALVVSPGDPAAIARATLALLRADSLRSRIVSGGIKRSLEMSWDRSVAQLDLLLHEHVIEPQAPGVGRRAERRWHTRNPNA